MRPLKQVLYETLDQALPAAEPIPTSSSSVPPTAPRAPARARARLRLVQPCLACDGGYLPDGAYCDCYQGQRERRLNEEQQATLLGNRERALAACFREADEELLGYTWESYPREGDQDALAYVRALPGAWEGKRGLVLTGGIGTGKTVMMVCLFRELIPRVARLPRAIELGNWRARFARMLKILDELKGALQRPTERGEPGFSEVLAEYRDAYLLCIDDVGVEKLTPFVAEQFYGIVNERIWKGLPTFMTTNLTLLELQAHLSPRVWSRLLPKVDLVEVGGPDLREQEALRQLHDRRGGRFRPPSQASERS
jgi:DNA replication protein DnaC